MALSRAGVYALVTSLIACTSCNNFEHCLLSCSTVDDRIKRLMQCTRFSCYFHKLSDLLEKLNERELTNFLCSLLSRVVPCDLPTLDNLVRCRDHLLRVLAPWLSENEVVYLVLASLELSKLTPLILDPLVEDIYLSDQTAFCVKTGGVIENINLGDAERKHLLTTFIKLAQLAGYELSASRPTATFTLKLGSQRLRVTVDVWPVTSCVTVHIRNLRALFTLNDLIEIGTLSKSQADKIMNHVLAGGHVIIAGPPGSGKTTLLIALDLALPKSIRRVYIDEFDEFPDIDEFPQLKYRSIYGRVREIEHVLVRGGGLLIIGELRAKDHFNAFRLAIESGLQVLTTVHASTLDELKAKLLSFMKSDVHLLSGRAMLVFMETRGAIRKVREIQLFND